MNETQPKQFWITNISKIIITIADLDVVIYPWRSLNIAKKGFNLTHEQLEASKTSGSLFKLKKHLIISDNPPNYGNKKYPEVVDVAMSFVKIKPVEHLEKESLLGFDTTEQNKSDDQYLDDILTSEDLPWNPNLKKKPSNK